MKYTNIGIITVIIGCNLFACQQGDLSPFALANQKYNESDWNSAYTEYKSTLRDIDKAASILREQGVLDKDIKQVHLDALVNYADVTFAIAAGKYNEDKETAQKLMLKACNHWDHRLEARKFG